MRSTPAARLVAEVLKAYATPLTLGELHELVKQRLPRTAYSTVYRVVSRLEADGRVVRVDWRERGSRFEWADLPHHHHIVCSICGRTADLDHEDLGFSERRIENRTGFRVNHHSIELEGICRGCQRSV